MQREALRILFYDVNAFIVEYLLFVPNDADIAKPRKTRPDPDDGKISTCGRPSSLQPFGEVSAYGQYEYYIVQST